MKLSMAVPCLGFLCASGAFAAGMEGAPPPFAYRNSSVVPVDIESVDVDYEFDVASQLARAHAVVRFHADKPGFPMVDLVPAPTKVSFNGDDVDPSLYENLDDPTRVTKIRVLRQVVEAGSTNVLTVDYKLDSNDVTFSSGGVRSGFFMDDLGSASRGFFENFGPANYEFDQVHYRFTVKVTGTGTVHKVYTNGALAETGANQWEIDFPAYFTTSSPYFHIADRGRFKAQTFTVQGIEKNFPVTVYSESASLTQSAATSTRQLLAELEATYGAFAHDRLVAYVTPTGGGMEHCGATMTSLDALGHELTHSWFARGVMPVNGNSGWIDEAIASWRDNNYPRSAPPNRSPVNLGNFSAYRRHTTMDAYRLGARLISEFDGMFASKGGMKSALRSLFAERQRNTIDVAYFQRFLEGFSGQSLTAIFNRYVDGRSSLQGFTVVAPEQFAPVDTVKHPRRYTPEEIARFR